ncbi:class I SAM-dependent methyltransferase [Ferdinandcohnia quinoae]|uniref:Class I SAM-dependent methyltransferase n=1 Tax=Fredinandcohnia quinoae TaxID=2918902 RepID=A0AAW5E4G0_9BACI|nr:class I SAM-dependent methyltransferase [Fredinandcohnia sp. SECRCQ15]MCH1626429.1 class I SAM-dependent methyltransferase [Fredinandcohnia sp. SECRCQ15]
MKINSMVDNFEEYDDPILYDMENDMFRNEVPFVLKRASKIDGHIIDLACGTGRVTIPLARAGYQMIGVDLHKGMLEHAKQKTVLGDLQIEWVKQDCTKLDLKVKSKLMYMVGNSFQHFHTNESQDQLLSGVNRHLEDEGIFVFDTRFPSKEELLQPSTEEFWRSYVDRATEREVDVYTISNYDSLNQIQHYITIRRFKDEKGIIVDEKQTNISLRYVFPQEMERIMAANGFEILEVYQDWKETPISNDSYQMIYVCKKVGVKY